MRPRVWIVLLCTTALALLAAPGDARAQGIGVPKVRDSNVGYIDPAIPGDIFRLRVDGAYDNIRPSRADFFWSPGGPFGPGPSIPESSVNYQDIAAYLETHAREETGHERLALKDLRELGLPAERIVANLVPKEIKQLCELFDHLAASDYPVGCLGYSYCFEFTAAMKQKCHVDALTELYPKDIDASRFLRTHSSLGSEISHVEDLIEFISGLLASDRTEIVRATYETAATMAKGLRLETAMSDSEILTALEVAAGEKLRLPT